jgi:HEAT repeat protein
VIAIHAADLAGIIGAQECIPLLIARLSAPDPLVRLACARALGELGCSEAIAQIVQALASGEHATELSEILIGFGAIAEPLLCDRLRRCERSEERWLAALTLGELHARGAVADLVAVLEDPDEELVARAARALGRIGDACAVAPLTAILARQRSWFVDVAAATALGKLEDPAGAPALAQTLCSDDWSVRNAAARSLAVLGDAGVLAVLKRAGGVLAPEPIAHFAGVLDVSDRLERLLERAAAGEAEMDQFARAACASGVRSRLIELASERDDRVGAYASSVLARAGAGA